MALRFRGLPVALLVMGMGTGAAFAQQANKPKDDVGQIGSRKVTNCVNFYSIEKEMALGKQLAAEVEKQARVLEDPLVGEFINRVGQNLVRSSDAKVPFQFRVIEGDAPNAFALPGGYVFVYTGLLRLAGEEDELAAAMAHEIAHVAARHMTCQATRSQLAGIAGIPAGILLGGWGGWAARQGMGIALPAAFLRFSRGDESEADYLGVQYLYAAGYDPNGAISIFEKIESLNRRSPGLAGRILSTHPMDADRIRKTEEEIARILPSRTEHVVTTSEYEVVRARALGPEKTRKPADPSRPVLRRSSAADEQPAAGDRPTIKRRDLVE